MIWMDGGDFCREMARTKGRRIFLHAGCDGFRIGRGPSWSGVWGQGSEGVPRSCREQGLDLSGVGPTSGQQKSGKDYESLFGEINYFYAPPPHHKNKTMLRKIFLEETLQTINSGKDMGFEVCRAKMKHRPLCDA